MDLRFNVIPLDLNPSHYDAQGSYIFRKRRFSSLMHLPYVHAAATTPVQQLGVFLAHLTPPYQPSAIPLSGRPAHRPFRGLLGVYSRCGLHTRAVTLVTAIRGLQTFRHLHACPGCFRRERSPGGPCTHLSGALVSSGNFQHRGLHFCGSCDGVGMINGSFAIAANSGKCAGRPRFCHCGKDRINLSPVRSSGP